MPEQEMETLDTLYNLYANGGQRHQPAEIAELARAANDAFECWRQMSNVEALLTEIERNFTRHPNKRTPQRMAATRAYVAAYELWQEIERLGVELLAEPAYSHAEPAPEPVEPFHYDENAPGGVLQQLSGYLRDGLDLPLTQETSPASQLDTSDPLAERVKRGEYLTPEDFFS